jgi:major membrane immunogen (membrane-anchored lipoprotein)
MPSGSDADLRWFIPGFKKDKITTGTMNLTGTFTSTYNKAKDIIPNMEGSFHVSITDGKIAKFTVLSKILSMLNIARIIKLKVPDLFSKGMPFDSIESDFVMKDGAMKTDDFILMGSAMNLSAVGTINVLKEEVDFTVSAQLLRTIGKVLGNIPIAKDIFTGQNRLLTIGYFRVKGPYKDISVKPLPRNSIDRAILKIFKKIIDIPRDIILPKHDDKHDEGTDNKTS